MASIRPGGIVDPNHLFRSLISDSNAASAKELPYCHVRWLFRAFRSTVSVALQIEFRLDAPPGISALSPSSTQRNSALRLASNPVPHRPGHLSRLPPPDHAETGQRGSDLSLPLGRWPRSPKGPTGARSPQGTAGRERALRRLDADC